MAKSELGRLLSWYLVKWMPDLKLPSNIVASERTLSAGESLSNKAIESQKSSVTMSNRALRN